jgi:phosphoribosylaminoimidazolecarboxamide formyltransferase/IMP cyclohydrolase
MMQQLPNKPMALLSVFYKDGLDVLVEQLVKQGYTLLSTGGTRKFIEGLGHDVVAVEDLTGYPSILGGRVKTLHPKVFGGILGRRDLENDRNEMRDYEIPNIDVVVVDLYPFEETVAEGGTHEEIIEKIDIGGISLIRAAAKNYKDTWIISSRSQYNEAIEILKSGKPGEEHRKQFATKAFAVSSSYDTAIHAYLNGETAETSLQLGAKNSLRYGENPHQEGAFYGQLEEVFTKLHGKELSYNNLLDADAAVNLIHEFDELTLAILKHNNACGLASRSTLKACWEDALAADPVSAFGGVIITNGTVDAETAGMMNELFFEIIIAKGYDADALEILQQKKNRIILILKDYAVPQKQYRSLLNGMLVQDRDAVTDEIEKMKTKTTLAPSAEQLEDLAFASKICKHTKSNTIVLTKGKQLLGSGTGQTSRVDALRHAINKAKSFNLELENAVMASDAFFPFPDCVEIAGKEGIKAVVQPGGSVKDQLSIDYCNENGLAMVFTGTRHFKH